MTYLDVTKLSTGLMKKSEPGVDQEVHLPLKKRLLSKIMMLRQDREEL